MSGFYFETENNHYFYDNSTGAVQVVSDANSNDCEIVYGNEMFINTITKEDTAFYVDNLTSTHLILIVTEECNLRCKYCAYSGIYSHQRVHSKNSMSIETAQKAIDKYFEFFKKVKHHNMLASPSIGFYGGEPLINFDTIKYAIEHSKNIYHGNIIYTATVNSTLLTEEIIKYFVENNVHLVVSLNGNKSENDRSRVFPNGDGTFEIIMQKINYIRKNFPDYYKSNFAISATIDVGTNLIEFDNFFSQKKFANTPMALSRVLKSYCNWYDQFGEKTKELHINQLMFLRDKFYEIKKSTGDAGRVKNGLFQAIILLVLYRSVGSVTTIIPFTEPCIPGMKIAVDYQGNIYVCEKVNNSRPIGNVETWIDYDLVYDMLNTYIETIGPRCINCPVNRMCTVCYKDVFDGNGEGHAPDEEWCKNYINDIQSAFKTVYSFLESGYTCEQLIGEKKEGIL